MQNLMIYIRVIAVAYLAMCSAHACSDESNSIPLFELVDIEGVRENRLVGFGIVVGLDGSGDKSQIAFTGEAIQNMLEQFGIKADTAGRIKTKNAASVMVTATMASSAGRGQALNVVVSSVGDAKSLRGGTLLMTPLKGVDGQVYAVAQGNLVVPAMSAAGANGSSVTVNTPTGGTIPGGAIIEKALPSNLSAPEMIALHLREPSFTTARNIARQVNAKLGKGVAAAVSEARIELRGPKDRRQRVGYFAILEEVKVQRGASRARIVFNARAGTIVIGQNVRVREAAVSHGSLTIRVTESQNVVQPNEFGGGETATESDSLVSAEQTGGKLKVIRPAGTTLADIVDAINTLGASPDDLMAILQALSQVGALDAELIVI